VEKPRVLTSRVLMAAVVKVRDEPIRVEQKIRFFTIRLDVVIVDSFHKVLLIEEFVWIDDAMRELTV
jgi:hypothetical protein